MKRLLIESVILKIAPDSGSASTWTLSAGTSDVNSGVVDMSTYQGNSIEWLIDSGTLAGSGALTVTAQHSDDGTTFTDISGTEVTWADTDDDKRQGITVTRIAKRYQRLKIVRGDAGNSSIAMIQAFVSGLRAVPCTQIVTAGQFIGQPKVVAP